MIATMVDGIWLRSHTGVQLSVWIRGHKRGELLKGFKRRFTGRFERGYAGVTREAFQGKFDGDS